MKVKILRGVPGAGKTTTAKQLFVEMALKGAVVTTVSADHYFERSGMYLFDAKKLGEAHNECFREYVRTIVADANDDAPERVDLLIVDNTHTTFGEILPYVRVADAFGVPYEILTVECDPALAHARGLHGVPVEKVWQMHRRLMDASLPKHWPHRIVKTTLDT